MQQVIDKFKAIVGVAVVKKRFVKAYLHLYALEDKNAE